MNFTKTFSDFNSTASVKLFWENKTITECDNESESVEVSLKR